MVTGNPYSSNTFPVKVAFGFAVFLFVLSASTAAHATGLSLRHAEPGSPLIYATFGGFLSLSAYAALLIFLAVLLISCAVLKARVQKSMNAITKELETCRQDLAICRGHEKFMNDIMKHFNDYLFFHDMDGNFLDYNPAHQKDSDYSRNDMQQMNIKDLVPEAYKHEVADYLERIRKTDFDSGYINVFNRRGEPMVLEYMSSVIRSDDGKAIGVRGISRNVTEGMEARKAIRESEKKYRGILDSIEDGYYEVDLKGNYEFFNAQFCRLLGCPCDELLGKNYRDIVHDDYQKTVFETFNYVYRTGNPIKTFDWQMVRKDGYACFVETSISLRKDENGQPVGFQGILRDVTERAKAQEKRKELENQLHQSQKMESIGTLAGGIAHDFNNILFPIIGYTELAMKGVPMCSKTYENLEKVLKSANRARDLIEQILNFSRRSADEEVHPIQIQPVILETLNLLSNTIPANIEIRHEINRDTGKILITPSRIHQVIMNLCTNAYQAMEECSTGTLSVSLEEAGVFDESSPAWGKVTPGNYLRLSVSDTGCGIEPDLADKIFEPYFTTKSRDKGTGLGLSVSYGIIKNTGGTIRVESEPGRGTRFDVYLRVADDAAFATEERYSSETDPTGSERILLVDDEQRIVDLQQQVLESLGYHVTAVADSTQALELFRRRPDMFDLLLTDQAMPKMTGIDLAENIRKLRPDIPIVLCTGYTDKVTRERSAKRKINGMLQKPISRSDLAYALRKALDKTG